MRPYRDLPYQTCHSYIATFYSNSIIIDACGVSFLGLFAFMRMTLSGPIRQ
jgi:hypothetical protein